MILDHVEVKLDQAVLLLWSGNQPAQSFQSAIEVLTSKVGTGGKVQPEHIERLTLCKFISIIISFKSLIEGVEFKCFCSVSN